MKEIKISIKVAFRSDALLRLYFYRDGKLYYSEVWSQLTPDEENYWNDKYVMNLQETEHSFIVRLEDSDAPDYDSSYVEFGFTGKRSRWVGPGRLKTVPLGDLIERSK